MNIFDAIDALHDSRFAELDAHFNGLQQRYENEAIDDFALWREFSLARVGRVDLIPRAEAWALAYPDSYAAHHAAAALHVRAAWQARGVRPAVHTSPRQIAQMSHHCDQAKRHLETAVTLTPVPVLSLLQWGRVKMAGEVDEADADHTVLINRLRARSPLLCAELLGALYPTPGSREHRRAAAPAQLPPTVGSWTEEQQAMLQSAQALHNAEIAREQNHLGLALSHVDMALALSRSSTGLSVKAGLLSFLGQHAEAAALYTEAVAMMPNATDFHALGQTHALLGHMPEAAEAFERALALGHGESASELLAMHQAYLHQPEVAARAGLWFDQGVGQYAAEVMFLRGCAHLDGTVLDLNPAEARRWWQAAGEWGYSEALVQLAWGHAEGRHGWPLDESLAFQLACQAADLGAVGVDELLGLMHFHGRGTPANPELALPCLEAAAEAGSSGAMASLIRAFWLGQGTRVDRAAAREWLLRLKERDAKAWSELNAELTGPRGWLGTAWAQWRQPA
ncbi:MAG: hypothetical protein RLZZ618_1331 [Pseudomonadota bacterium]